MLQTTIEQCGLPTAVPVQRYSTCCCRRVRHFSENCGHRHRTEDAALRCREKLLGYSNGSCSATWYNSRVVKFDRATGSEISRDHEGNPATVESGCTC